MTAVESDWFRVVSIFLSLMTLHALKSSAKSLPHLICSMGIHRSALRSKALHCHGQQPRARRSKAGSYLLALDPKVGAGSIL